MPRSTGLVPPDLQPSGCPLRTRLLHGRDESNASIVEPSVSAPSPKIIQGILIGFRLCETASTECGKLSAIDLLLLDTVRIQLPERLRKNLFSRQKPKIALLDDLRRQGIVDERVLRAMDQIPREHFVEPEHQEHAWANVALAISSGQTISQPLVVASMSQALAMTGTERVLEIGTGSGYQAAILSVLAREVITIERIPSLAETAAERFATLGLENIQSFTGDGSDGWESGAPYDAIIVTAGTAEEPDAFLAQLDRDHGRLVIPLGPADDERLTLFRFEHGRLIREDLGGVRFVPLIRDRPQEHNA